MKKIIAFILIIISIFGVMCENVNAQDKSSIIVATGSDVPTDDYLEEYDRFPEKYRDKAVQFRTQDGVLLSGYVLGSGNKGITLARASGWNIKSWLPFAERLVDEGYMVIIWEFRGEDSDELVSKWKLDVLAAVEVLKEKGATQILSMGASNGGTATAVASPDIDNLVGLVLLSSPSINPIGNTISSVKKLNDIPMFFAASTNDLHGIYPKEVKSIYDASISSNKQFYEIEGSDHGTDMITPDMIGADYPPVDGWKWTGYGSPATDNAHKQKRQEFSDKLMNFVNETFENVKEESIESNNSNNSDNSNNANSEIEKNSFLNPITISLGILIILIIVILVSKKKK